MGNAAVEGRGKERECFRRHFAKTEAGPVVQFASGFNGDPASSSGCRRQRQGHESCRSENEEVRDVVRPTEERESMGCVGVSLGQ